MQVFAKTLPSGGTIVVQFNAKDLNDCAYTDFEIWYVSAADEHGLKTYTALNEAMEAIGAFTDIIDKAVIEMQKE